MSQNFIFTTPPKIIVGWGSAKTQLATAAAVLGRKPLVVTGTALRKNGFLEPILDYLRDSGLRPDTFEGVPAEPNIAVLQRCMEAAVDADCIIAIGGGSVLDIGKAAAALAGTGKSAREYFQGNAEIPTTGKPILAVPTTAGTGSEATRVSVLIDTETGRKASIRGDSMMPMVALLDAELTVSCPPNVTAASGMDAFVQAVEAYTSNGANPLTDALAIEAVRMTAPSTLQTAFLEPQNQAARESMLPGTLMAGLALNTSRLGLVHGLAHPVGGITGAAHGLVCALLLPPVLRFNREIARDKYAQIAQIVMDEKSPDMDRFIAGIEAFITNDLKLPKRLSAIGLQSTDIEKVAREAMVSGSTKANPRPVSEADARAVLEDCL